MAGALPGVSHTEADDANKYDVAAVVISYTDSNDFNDWVVFCSFGNIRY